MGLSRGEFLVNDVAERLTLLKVVGPKAINPANGKECAIVEDTHGHEETFRKAGLTAWGAYSNTWHFDEVCLMINGQRGWLWRASRQ
jgi:hypothetical protein